MKKIIKLPLMSILISFGGLQAIQVEINGKLITEEKLINMVGDYVKIDYEKASVEEKEEAIQRVIDMEIVLNEAESMGLSREKDFKKNLEKFKKMHLIQNYTKKMYDNIKITHEDLNKYYEGNKNKFEGKEKVLVYNIVVKRRSQALLIIKKLSMEENPVEKFKELAKIHSVGPEGKEGGLIGWIQRNEVVQEIEKEAFMLKKGGVSTNPLKTNFGYHIIYVMDRKKEDTITKESFIKMYEANPSIIKKYKEQKFALEMREKMKQLRRDSYKINIIK